MHSVVKNVLDKARSQKGVQEAPPGSNSGPQVRAYLRATGLGGGHPWCAAFLAWCVKQVETTNDIDIAFPKTASCDVILQFARRHDILYTEAQPGDVFLVLASPNDATHTGFVDVVSNANFTTIEGNSNSNGSREGKEVCANIRAFKSRYRFVRWGALLHPEGLALDVDPPTLTYELFLSGVKIFDMEVTNGIARMEADRWCQALGFELGWDGEDRCVLIDDSPVPATPLLKNDKAYLPIRVLAEFSGLTLRADIPNRQVFITKPGI